MPVIALVGPHAVGKTLAAGRWNQRWPTVTRICCDKDLPRESPGSIVLLEGCSAMANRWIKKVPIVLAIHCYCPPQRMEANMQARCLRRNKPYREDYWTPRWLQYEAYTRMDNLLRKLGIPRQEFQIADYAADWPTVDAYFDRLFMRLHNQLNRERRRR